MKTTKQCILVVDDNTENLRLLCNILAGEHYKTRVATSGQMALTSVQAKAPDLILLDIIMPDINGYEVCSRLKANEETREIPVIFISAARESQSIVKSFFSGGVDYITKPFQAEEVIARIKIHLSLRALQTELEDKVNERTEKFEKANVQLQKEIAEREQAEEVLRLNEARLEALLTLDQMTDLPMKAITDFALKSAIDLTKSNIGYLAFVNEDETVLTMHSWSKNARKDNKTIDIPGEFPIEATGLWGETVRQRKPIITNDYSETNPSGKALPTEHIKMNRHMNVPIFDGKHIAAIAGVGNKDEDYDDSDLRQLTLMMDGMWQMIQRKQSAETIIKERDRANRYLDLANVMFVAINADKTVSLINRKGCEVLGYKEEELIGKNWFENFLSLNVRDKVSNVFDGLISGNSDVPEHFENSVLTKKGEERIIAWNNRLLRDADRNIIGILSCGNDITDRKRTEKELEYRTVLLSTQLESSPDGILVVNREGKWVSFNRRLIEMWEIPEDVVESRSNERALHSLKNKLVDADKYLSRVKYLYEHPEDNSHEEIYLNQGKTFDSHSYPMRRPDSEILGRIWFFRDVTKQKYLERQLRQAQRMEAVGQLAGGIAHDFNNLLQAILGYGQMAMEDIDPSSNAYEEIEQVLKAGERATNLVRQLLAFSRRQVLKLEEVDLNQVVDNLAKIIRRVIGEHITLNISTTPLLDIVRADLGQMEQIVMNLCVNARDAMPEGGQISIKTENVILDEEYCEINSISKPGHYVALSVTDTGSGIDKETQRHIFEPFFTTKEMGRGTGLGLSTVYGIAQQHEGFITVCSKVGTGTTFKIYLPMSERSANSARVAKASAAPGGTETILLAEDDELVRTLATRILENAGYTVLSVEDGQQALQTIDNNAEKIDLALLDVVMPKLGGRAVYNHLREKRPEIKALFASGYSADTIHTNFVLDKGMNLVQKPYDRDELLRRIREVLDSQE